MAMEVSATNLVDPVSNVLKWVLLAVAVVTFSVLGWTIGVTYQEAPPFPDRFVTTEGTVLMTSSDIQAGKAGFQKADLMDYGSLYGMGSYFGPDYTAEYLVRLGQLTEDNINKVPVLATDRQTTVRSIMQSQLQGVDLTKREAVIPNVAAASIKTLQGEIAEKLQHDDFAKGWTQAYSLDEEGARKTADFLIYSSLDEGRAQARDYGVADEEPAL